MMTRKTSLPTTASQTEPALHDAYGRAFPQPRSFSERRRSGSNDGHTDTGQLTSVGLRRSNAVGANQEGSRHARPQADSAPNGSPLPPLRPKPRLDARESAAMLQAPFPVQPNHIPDLTPYKHSRNELLPEPSWLLHGFYGFLGRNKNFTADIRLLLRHLSNGCAQGLRGVQAAPPRFSGTATVAATGAAC